MMPVLAADVDSAAELMDAYEALWARDALHAAVAFRVGVTRICSYDHNLDIVAGLERIEPEPAR